MEMVAAGVITAEAAITVYRAAVAIRARNEGWYRQARLTLSKFLVLALEFQLAADVLGTSLAPSWDHIGKLAAFAGLRTAINFFLEREMCEIRLAAQAGSA